ncbi:MAG: hypothetical protein ABSH38_01015 [Verrucomicrobiota bacterium]|jgi:hypothetical protein
MSEFLAETPGGNNPEALATFAGDLSNRAETSEVPVDVLEAAPAGCEESCCHNDAGQGRYAIWKRNELLKKTRR